MAQAQPPLKIKYSPAALRELGRIWVWNANQYGIEHANAYVDFLRKQIDELSTQPMLGREVGSDARLRYLVMRRKHVEMGIWPCTVSQVIRFGYCASTTPSKTGVNLVEQVMT